MGPISDFTPDIASAALQKIIENSSSIKDLQLILEDPGAYTKSGKVVTNPITSKAMISGANGFNLGAAEGKTVSQATKEIARLNNENAILRAVAALGQEIPSYNPKPPAIRAIPVIQRVPATPKVPATPTLLSRLNPILTALQLLTYPSNLNENEDAELAVLRAK